MRRLASKAGLLLVAVATMGSSLQTNSGGQKKTASVEADIGATISASRGTGSEVCSGCHSEIYKSYMKTVMATASGPAAEGVITGEFDHKASGVHYKVYELDGSSRASLGPGESVRLGPEGAGCARGTDECVRSPTVWMSYERTGDEEFRGQRELLYFIGSGRKGRSYLFSEQGFLFESPINWYSQEGRWNMTPAYTEARESPMNLPAYVDCLNCHTSGMRPPVAGTDSKFSGAPFLHGGITCQRCHGAGEGHGATSAAASRSGPEDAGCARGTDECVRSHMVRSHMVRSQMVNPIVNPAKLAPERRDAVCMECHFEGTVAVEQPGRHLYQFQPGERLADYIHYFLLRTNQGQASQGPANPAEANQESSNPGQTGQALSQFEALSLSMCKQKSGDAMWCGSCHDPHREPSAAERVEYYRGKCLACHGQGGKGAAFAEKHHADKRDCTACHMPALPSKDVAHTEVTDHRILRNPNGPQLETPRFEDAASAPRLVSFPEGAAAETTTRDFALAWESLAQRGVPGASREAEKYLREAVKERPEDAVLLGALGFVEQEQRHEKEARELYERALKIDPLDNDAADNLGILEAQAGHLGAAVKLWQGAFERVPNRSAIGMNLALAFCAAGQTDDARRYVERVLEFNPDFRKGRGLLKHLNSDPVECRP